MAIVGDHQELSERVIGLAIEVHKELGPGLLESAYESCLAIALVDAGLRGRRQVAVPLRFRGRDVGAAYRIDLLVEDRLVLEIKAVSAIEPIHEAQLLTYLRCDGYTAGLLMNFHAPTLREGIRRVVLSANAKR